ncbi:MAG TPA: rod shape-determining protein MreD [Flavobacteriales bacterium]|nr:rod shape-determining protein MreD [Flavobacteriales bacterium]HNU57381.1 rod shape-determining protein MreD [Flavobacteriales bacterium]
MIGTILGHILRFIALILLQVLVLDHLDVLNGLMVPYLYVFFLLMLPIEMPAWAQLAIGAVTGLVMDFFTSTPGMHMSACVVMMYARLQVLRLLSPREGYEYGSRPTVMRMGFPWYITYAGLLILLHHLWLFFVELHRFDAFFGTFFRAVLSAVFSFALCLLAQFLTSGQERDRR